MVFDVFPTIIPAITAPVKPTELTSSDWAKGVEKVISIEFTPTFDEATGIDLAFITPYGFDLASVTEIALPNILAEDSATLIEALAERTLIAYEYGYLSDIVSSIAFSSYDLATGFDLSYFTPKAIDFGELVEIYAVPNILAYDSAVGLELYRRFLEAIDKAFGVEKLGDRTFSSADFSIAIEKAIKSFLTSDYAQAIDFGQLMLIATDLATSLEQIPSREFVLVDLATGLDRLIERYLEVIDARIGIDRVIIEFEESCMKVFYFAFGTYGFVHIYSIDNFTPPFVVEAKFSPRTAKGHDARLDLYYPDKLGYHPADAYGSYLHAWGSGDPEGDPFKGLFAWGFRTDTESLLNKSMDKEFYAGRWYIFRIIQQPNNTKFQVYGEKRDLLAVAEHTSGHNVDLKVVIGACNEDNQGFVQEVWYDWVFVRKYIEPEPSISIGSEETSPVSW